MNTEQYFYRNFIFSKQGQTISMIDIHNPDSEGEVLDPWFAMVFQLADGQHTVQQLIDHMSRQYDGNPPGNLRETIDSVVQRMTESRLIMLTDEKTELPYYLSAPIEILDVERVKQELSHDRADLN
jgi:hypothetical protein